MRDSRTAWFVEASARSMAAAGAACAFVIFVSMVVDVLGREVFKSSTEYAVDLSELLMVPLVFLVLPYVAQIGANVRVDILIDRMSASTRNICEFVSLILFLLFAALICWVGWLSTYEAYHFGSVTAAGIPIWPALLAIPVGGFVLCAQLFVQIVRAFKNENRLASE